MMSGIALAVGARQAEAGAFAGSGFQVEQMAGFLLVGFELAAHEFQGFLARAFPSGLSMSPAR
jgi:hypothetical protein